MRFSRLQKYKRKHRSFWFLSKIVATCYLILFSALYLTSDTEATFVSEKKTKAGILAGFWEPKSYSLIFTEKGNKKLNSCEAQVVTMKIKNKGPGDLEEEGEFSIFYSEKQGNPKKHGNQIGKGIVPILKNGEIGEVSYKVTQPGFYQFKVKNSDSEVWSEKIIFCPEGRIQPKNEKGKDESQLNKQNKTIDENKKVEENLNIVEESLDDEGKKEVNKEEINNNQDPVEENNGENIKIKDESQEKENAEGSQPKPIKNQEQEAVNSKNTENVEKTGEIVEENINEEVVKQSEKEKNR